jgi:hypothetical protein
MDHGASWWCVEDIRDYMAGIADVASGMGWWEKWREAGVAMGCRQTQRFLILGAARPQRTATFGDLPLDDPVMPAL